jgi:hypothetical protein
MNKVVTYPPTWVRSTFHLLIVVVLLACVVTFILKASCLFTEPDPQSITYTIVVFGVGLSLICVILWVGAVTGIINISPNIQKALWVTLIAAVLSITVSVYKGFFSSTYTYKVTGTVTKMDGKDPRDIIISETYPPHYPIPQTERNVGLDVVEDSRGKFPVLSFSHPAYKTQPIDLNDSNKVEAKNGELNIKDKIVLEPMPGGDT